MKLQGNLQNRLMEKNNKVQEIKVGTDVTKYWYSDRTCGYVTKVIDQKHIFVKEYFVAPDWTSSSMSNSWKFFKSYRDYIDYQNKNCPHNIKLEYNEKLDNQEFELVYRYNAWYSRYTDCIGRIKYARVTGLLFGIKDYYVDYEF